MAPGACNAGSEIDTAAILFPVAESGGLGAPGAADFTGPRFLALLVVSAGLTSISRPIDCFRIDTGCIFRGLFHVFENRLTHPGKTTDSTGFNQAASAVKCPGNIAAGIYGIG